MNGSAPNSPDTGSQVRPFQNPNPNFSIESRDWWASTTPMPRTTRQTRTAKAPVPRRKPRSLRKAVRDGRPFMSGLLDPAERRHLHLHDARGKGRVAELGAVLLPVGEGPLHEVHHDLGLRLVLRVLVEQQPREGRDRVDALPGSVRDGDAEVRGHPA